MKYAAVYWIDCDEKTKGYINWLIRSIKSIRKFDKKIDIVVISPNLLPTTSKKYHIKLIKKEGKLNVMQAKCLKYYIFEEDFSKYDKRIYLDADTIINGNLSEIIKRHEKYDFVARIETGSNKEGINKLNRKLKKYNLKLTTKGKLKEFFNTGVFIFNPNISKKLLIELDKSLKKKVKNPIYSVKDGKLKNQGETKEEIRFTTVLKKVTKNMGLLDKDDHGYYWEGDRLEDSKILHISSFFYPEFMKERNQIYALIHIPKTGGASIKYNIWKNFKFEEILNLSDTKFKRFKSDEKLDHYLRSQGKNRLKKVKVIIADSLKYSPSKHFNKNLRYIVFLRNPIKRTISSYNYQRTVIEYSPNFPEANDYKKMIMKDGEFIELDKLIKMYNEYLPDDNYMVKFLSRDKRIRHKERGFNEPATKEELEEAKRFLDKCYFIGLTENKEDFLFTYKLLGITRLFANKNISKKYYEEYYKKNKEYMDGVIKSKNLLDIELYNYAKELNKKFKLNEPFFENVPKNIKAVENKEFDKKFYTERNKKLSIMLRPIYLIEYKLREFIASHF